MAVWKTSDEEICARGRNARRLKAVGAGKLKCQRRPTHVLKLTLTGRLCNYAFDHLKRSCPARRPIAARRPAEEHSSVRTAALRKMATARFREVIISDLWGALRLSREKLDAIKPDRIAG